MDSTVDALGCVRRMEDEMAKLAAEVELVRKRQYDMSEANSVVKMDIQGLKIETAQIRLDHSEDARFIKEQLTEHTRKIFGNGVKGYDVQFVELRTVVEHLKEEFEDYKEHAERRLAWVWGLAAGVILLILEQIILFVIKLPR